MKTVTSLLILISVLSFNIATSFAQSHSRIDSLKNTIDTSQSMLDIIETYLLLGHEIENQQPDSAILIYRKIIILSHIEINNKDSLYVVEIKKSLLIAYNNLGLLYQNKGITPDAYHNYQLGLSTSKSINNKKGIALSSNNLGVLSEQIGEIEDALKYYKQSLKIRQELNDKHGIAVLFFNIGYIYDEQGEVDNAMDYYNKSLQLYLEIGDKQGEAECLNNIGYVYKLKGDNQKALEYYNTSLAINQEIGNKKSESTLYNNIGRIYQSLGDIPKAMEYFHKSLDIRKEIGYKKGIANSNNNIGLIYYRLGEVDKALRYFKGSVQIQEEIGNKSGAATLYLNIGFLYNSIGEVSKALEYYNKCLNIYQELQHPKGISSVENNLGSIYNHQGDYKNALKYFNSALTTSYFQSSDKLKASIMNNIASVYLNQAQVEFQKRKYIKSDSLNNLAIEYYEKTMKLFSEINNPSGIASTYFNLGRISIYKADNARLNGNIKLNDSLLNKGRVQFTKGLEIFDQSQDKKGKTNTTGSLARICQKQNSIIDFKKYAFESYDFSKELGFPELIAATANIKRDYFITKRNYISADSFAIETMEINNTMLMSNFTTLSESGQEKYFSKVEDNYMEFNSYILMRKQEKPSITSYAYDNAIKNKGLLLKSSTAMRNAILNSNDTLLIKNYYQWILLKKQITKKYNAGKDIKALEAKADKYEKELVKNSQLFSDFKTLQSISWKEVRNGLKENEAAIEFVHFKFTDYTKPAFYDNIDTVLYCALIITSQSQYPIMIPLFQEKQLEEIIGKFGGNNLKYIQGIYGGKNVKTIHESSLYDLIWKPMEESLKGVKTIYLSPTGLLHKISFPAIAKEQNIYLCDIYDIEVKSSTGKIVDGGGGGGVKTHGRASQSATLFGGINYNTDSTTYKGWSYLEGTKTETQKINRILKKGKMKVSYFSNTSATEEEFKIMASNSNILHIATHGFFYPDPKEVTAETEDTQTIESNEISFRGGSRGFGVEAFVKNQNPLMRSGLVFAGANDVWSKHSKSDSVDDGVLTAQEVANIDMRNTKLVVMSACETGLGDIKGSEGVYGLQRAFKMAGVDYLIMSLWQVPDKETEEFMTTFYTKLIKQNNIKQAFNETRKEMRKKYDPYFWAAFVLIE